MSVRNYIHIRPTGMNPCSLEKKFFSYARKTWLCIGCGAPKPSIGELNIQIQEDNPSDVPLTFVSGCGIILARRDLIELFDKEIVRKDLIIGTVSGSTGEILEDWMTIRGHKRLIVRGSKNISYRCCESCGRHVYFAMGTPYLFPTPPSDTSVFESDLYGLIVSKDIVGDISLRKWPKLVVEILNISLQPKDQLGDLI